MKTDVDSLRLGDWFVHKYENHLKYNGPFRVLRVLWTPDEGKIIDCIKVDGTRLSVTVGSEPMWGDLEMYTVTMPKFKAGDGVAIILHHKEKAAHIILRNVGEEGTYRSCIVSFDTDKYLVPWADVRNLSPEMAAALDGRD
jgi:hypothetical protein